VNNFASWTARARLPVLPYPHAQYAASAFLAR
jgi:hypothetical protein